MALECPLQSPAPLKGAAACAGLAPDLRARRTFAPALDWCKSSQERCLLQEGGFALCGSGGPWAESTGWLIWARLSAQQDLPGPGALGSCVGVGLFPALSGGGCLVTSFIPFICKWGKTRGGGRRGEKCTHDTHGVHKDHNPSRRKAGVSSSAGTARKHSLWEAGSQGCCCRGWSRWPPKTLPPLTHSGLQGPCWSGDPGMARSGFPPPHPECSCQGREEVAPSLLLIPIGAGGETTLAK